MSNSTAGTDRSKLTAIGARLATREEVGQQHPKKAAVESSHRQQTHKRQKKSGSASTKLDSQHPSDGTPSSSEDRPEQVLDFGIGNYHCCNSCQAMDPFGSRLRTRVPAKHATDNRRNWHPSETATLRPIAKRGTNEPWQKPSFLCVVLHANVGASDSPRRRLKFGYPEPPRMAQVLNHSPLTQKKQHLPWITLRISTLLSRLRPNLKAC